MGTLLLPINTGSRFRIKRRRRFRIRRKRRFRIRRKKEKEI